MEFFCFSMIQQMLAIWSLVPLSFLNPAWTSGCSWFTYCWNLAWRTLSITLVVCEVSAIVWYFEWSLALPFSGIEMLTDLFQSCGYCWVFQICWHVACSTLTASSFKILNNLAGILSPPLALFRVMFPKTHMTSQSRMSSSRWVTTTSNISKVHPCHRKYLNFSSIYCQIIIVLAYVYHLLYIHYPLMDTWVISTCWWLWIMLLWMFLYESHLSLCFQLLWGV